MAMVLIILAIVVYINSKIANIKKTIDFEFSKRYNYSVPKNERRSTIMKRAIRYFEYNFIVLVTSMRSERII